MKSAMGIFANRIAVCLQQTGAQVDPEVLQWPGGSLIVTLILIRALITATLDSRRPYHV
jgi:hypothetical protein